MKPLIQASAGSAMQRQGWLQSAHSLRWIIWGATVLIMLVLPLVFSSGFAIALLSQMGIMIIFALSYNMLLGQTGMLSFGHAVYSGLGAFVQDLRRARRLYARGGARSVVSDARRWVRERWARR